MADQVSGFSIEPSCALEFGPGSVSRLPALVAGLAADAAFVVTDTGLRRTGIVDRVLAGLAAAGLRTGVFDGIGPNPSTTVVEAGAAALRDFGPCVVVGLGGGSVLDAAKGIALLATHPTARATDPLWDSAVDGLPLIAVPTTAGTGAETNGFGVVEDTCARRKIYLGHPSVRPRIAVLDPELTLGLPAAVTAATGFDALVHGVESLASRGANPVSDAAAAQAVALVGRWLPVAVEHGADLEARSQLLLGAHLAGQALTVSGLGLVHGIAHAVTAHLGTPHGVALAAVNEQVMRYSADAAVGAYERVWWALERDGGGARSVGAQPDGSGAAHPGAADPAGSGSAHPGAAGRGLAHPADPAAVIGTITALAEGVGVRRTLRDLGATRELLPVLAAAAVADPVTSNAPRRPTEAEVRDILAEAW
ncbi:MULTISPECIES: iron-containing alcohol dehydrogenase family protein [Pseudonocardia]|uniref:Alcohol dehydrogenase 2 n=2 Tax=Pseudonocardia TaxID=1847 RepID=A0A1Y2N3Z3_PSEAH|nr:MULTISPECIES: iron-containing alcohol dehydrogenase [Pseudonocardia]OSY42213.1 Alcohol dehydrogenase 2 [Pseudonocardia autotrophica]TDN75021.1 alcohol dehydrogenase/alcohol dehydrogenase [Pseudonocardia autotrophica]BBF98963.1 methanol dehydrogenase [Pseudonocardia autotrophica]GEC23883.1 methanol dehydrogenase [Pseudonocardia saturnea]